MGVAYHEDPFEASLGKLFRAQIQRDRGVPTLSALVGEEEVAARVWRCWCERTARGSATTLAHDVHGAVEAWLVHVCSSLDLRQLAIEHLAELRGENPSRVAGWLRDRTAFEVARCLDEVGSVTPAETILAPILEGPRPSGGDQWAKQLMASVSDPATLLFLLGHLLPRHLPGLLSVVPPDQPGRLEPITRAASEVAAALPRMPIGLSVSKHLYPSPPTGDATPSWLALLQECPVFLPATDSTEDAELEQAIERVHRLLRSWAAPVPIVDACEKAAIAIRRDVAAAGSKSAAAARSAAEAFLAALLDMRDATRGRFELNGRLPIPFGGHPTMEVDLLFRRDRVALELDGVYHFTDPRSYRRDRRKDWLLQREGHLVLRFLARDVLLDLETILATLDEALQRPRTAQTESAP